MTAVREGLADGTIDIVATDHAPHPHEAKDCEWSAGAFGMLGLQTALPIVVETMVASGLMSWAQLAHQMSVQPARIGQVDHMHGRPLHVGEPANLVLIDPQKRWTVQPEALASLSRNTPYAGISMPT